MASGKDLTEALRRRGATRDAREDLAKEAILKRFSLVACHFGDGSARDLRGADFFPAVSCEEAATDPDVLFVELLI